MKKLLSITLSLLMIMTAFMVMPSTAFAKANHGDILYGQNVYIDGNFEVGKKPSLLYDNDDYSKAVIHYSSGKPIGTSISVKDPIGNFADKLQSNYAFYEATYTMNMLDSDNVFRCFDKNYTNIYVNNNKIMNNTGNVRTFNSNGFENGGLEVKVKYYNLSLNTGECLGFFSPSQKITITAPDVKGKRFVNWTGENGNHQPAVFGDANSQTTTIKIEPAKNVVTPHYENISGWNKESDGKWYYYTEGVAKTGWFKDGGKWYFFDKSTGAMKTGWLKDGGKWYYFTSDGAMVAGKSMKIGGKTYNFNSSGVCTNP